MNKKDEQTLQVLIKNGNDEIATRLVFQLLELKPYQVQERIQTLLELGDRYLVLALMKTVEVLFAGRGEVIHSSNRTETSSETDKEGAILWYEEALRNYASIIELRIASPQDAYEAHYRQALAHMFLGDSAAALRDLTQAVVYSATSRQQEQTTFLQWIARVVARSS